MTTPESYAVAALLFVVTLLLWLPSLWQAANRKLTTLLADDGWLDEDHDAAMAAACERLDDDAKTSGWLR